MGSRKVLNIALLMLLSIGLTACGGGGSASSNTPVITPEPTTPPPAENVRDWWDVDAPDLSDNGQRPIITLNGNSTTILPIGSEYVELGATAMDPQDGDLSAQITILGEVDTEQVGDYTVRYSVVDPQQNTAIEKVRIVRVYDTEPARLSRRRLGDLNINLGYLERLPVGYGVDPEQSFPLIIYHHGNGANAEFWQDDPQEALQLVVENLGIPTIINAGRWEDDLPFVVLMPQAGFIEGTSTPDRIDIFVQHALLTYNIDPTRVYMMGWSQGGFISLEYAMQYPQTLAAVVPVASGLPFVGELPDNFCNLAELPIWIFHGDNDNVVPFNNSIDLFDAINNNCQPETAPRLTILNNQSHFVHHGVFDNGSMQGGRFGVESDPSYDIFDQNLYDWTLSFTNQRD